MEFEELIAQQKNILAAIQKLETNYKKDAVSRKTAAYLQARRETLEKYFREYTNNDDEIQKLEENQPDHQYWKERLTTKELYLSLKEELEQAEKKQQPSVSTIITQSNALYTKQKLKGEEFLQLVKSIEEELDTTRSKVYLKNNIRLVSDYWSNLTRTHEEIQETFCADNLNENYFTEQKYLHWQNAYRSIIVNLEEQLESIEPSEIKSTHPRPHELKMDVKLPRMNIPVFNGSFNAWMPFRDIYTQLIHTNATLGSATKMQYLKTYVSGDASQIIQHLQITDSNYDTAWKALTDRYDNERLLVSSYLKKLMSQPSLTSESTSGIRRMHDTTKETLHAIKNLQIDTNSWAPLLLEILIPKMDQETTRLYEQSLEQPKAIPTMEEFFKFLERRFQSLELSTKKPVASFFKQKPVSTAPQPNQYKSYKPQFNYHSTYAIVCRYCKRGHQITSCNQFKIQSIDSRQTFVDKVKLCTKCLSHYNDTACSSNGKCQKCSGQHHTLLHKEKSIEQKSTRQNTVTSNFVNNNNSQVVLATAILKVKNQNNSYSLLRALIDPGSQASFITEEAAIQLKLARKRTYVEVSGMANAESGKAISMVNLHIKPRHPSEFYTTFEALVLPILTKTLPEEKVEDLNVFTQNQNLVLADPTFNTPGPIDILIGADVFCEIIMDGVLTENKSIAQQTELGWIISGVMGSKSTNIKVVNVVTKADIEGQLKKLWEIEELPERRHTPDEEECEKIFNKTCRREENGRYTVHLPFTSLIEKLGSSKNRAVARILQMEKRFTKNEHLRTDYINFMEEYLRLGHMVPVPPPMDNKIAYYFPHHAVIKEESTTTKLRVVFDGSSKTSTGISLNETQLVGPRIQEDLMAIILRWRKHKYVYTADIEKMYRQINVCEEHQDFQRVVWRANPELPMQEFKLTTVTYGTASAPYLATKVLQKLAEDEKFKFPLASKITLTDFYVDDLLSGSSNLKEAMDSQRQIISMLQNAGFALRKWSSNNNELLKNIPVQSQNIESIELTKDETIKTLGIYWNPKTDDFSFKINLSKQMSTMTKRQLLSEASKLFDPLGWLAPATVAAKLLLQRTWVEKIDWDQSLPDHIQRKWIEIRSELPLIEELKIPRWIHQLESVQKLELHGFCDASEQAYSAVIYSKIIHKGVCKISLLMAKTKIAPLKTISLPRLELCGAVLLAKLFKYVIKSLSCQETSIHAWTDSTIVLAWLQGAPSKWKTFVSNRVTEIQNVISPKYWHHVPSEQNPADCASRGITPSQLIKHQTWFNGPQFIRKDIKLDDINFFTEDEIRKSVTSATTAVRVNNIFLEKYSTWNKTRRVIAYCLRFINNCRNQTKIHSYLSTKELIKAEKTIVRIVQKHEYAADIKQLQEKKPLSHQSKIISLNPIIDKDGLLRVGGRLQNSTLPFNEKHPIIVPKGHHITKLIITNAHNKTLHGGTEATLAYIRRSYWIIHGKDAVRHEIHKCISCFRFKAKTMSQIMGNLPAARITPSRPFTHVGVDYAGPLDVRMSKGRGGKTHKGYIAVFICLVTKAIHLELVSDMTTQTFLAAFRRFTSRRGLCAHIYSDCGTNFIGAQRELEKQFKLSVQQTQKHIAELITNDGTIWHFIPPASPHFGGLWEAGVKSMKNHLRKILGNQNLTYEELTTVLVQIEGCLNSRPLCPTSSDPNDMSALTPAHFLIGGPITTPPEPILDEKCGLVYRWKLIQQLTQGFWRRWSSEYLSRMQQRPKWLTKEVDIKEGNLVLIKDKDLPPAKWLLGRIKSIHPGKDGHVRVVTIAYKGGGSIKRPITKICRLPIDEPSSIPMDTQPQKQVTATLVGLKQSQQQKGNQWKTWTLTGEGASSTSVTHQKGEEQGQLLTTRDFNPQLNDSLLETASHNFKNDTRNWIRGQNTTHIKELAQKIRPVTNNFTKRKKVTINPCTIKNPFAYTVTKLSSGTANNNPSLSSTVKEENQTHATMRADHYSNDSPTTEEQSATRKLMRSLNTNKLTGQATALKNLIPAPKKRRITMPPYTGTNILFVTTVLCLILPTLPGLQNNIEMTPFQHQPGIYFEEIGQANLINSEWHIVIRFDLEQFWQGLVRIQHCLKLMEKVCQTPGVADTIYCQATLVELHHQLEGIENRNKLIKPTDIRRRRGLINAVGVLANELFGVLDQRAADRYEEQFATAQSNENHLLQLIRNQTTLIDSTVHVLKTSQNTISNQFNLFNHQLGLIMNQTNEEHTQLQKLVHLMGMASHAMMMMNIYQDTQRILLEVLLHTQDGKVHPLILSPSQLKNELKKIREHLPATMTIPDPQLLGTYQLLRISSRITETSILCLIKLPLINTEEFQVLKLVPVPTIHEEHVVFIQPSTEYLLVTRHREHYSPFNSDDMHNCVAIHPQHFICEHQQPIFNIHSTQNQCEMNLLIHKGDIHDACSLRKANRGHYWIKLHERNKWIYSITTDATIDLICGNNITTINLKGEGIIGINPPCVINDRHLTIWSQGNSFSNLTTSFLPFINISEYIGNADKKFLYNKIPNFPKNDKELEHIAIGISEIQHQEYLLNESKSSSTYHFIAIYATLSLIGCAIGFWIYTKTSKCKMGSSHQPDQCEASTEPPRRIPQPTPAPRQLSTIPPLLEEYV